MREASAQSTTTPRSLQRRSWSSGKGVRWTIGIAILAAASALFLAAVACAPASMRANNNLCLQQVADDEHANLEAFFQNPAEQEAFVQAITVCSR
jgi:hypothetical protein